jgi:hypothetical protein
MVRDHDCGGDQIAMGILLPTSGYSETVGENGRINLLVDDVLERVDFYRLNDQMQVVNKY